MANGWPNGGGDIIIKGGSVELLFDDVLYQRSPQNPLKRQNQNRKITRIVINDENAAPIYDSGETQDGLKWTITVSTK